MANHHLGIDIHPEGIRVVMLTSRLKSAAVSGQWVIDYPDRHYSPESLEAALAVLTQTVRIDGCECAVGFPASWAFLRQVALPFNDRKKIDQVLSFEMEPLLPVPVDGVLVDYQMAATTANSSVLLAAAVDKSLLTSIIATLGKFKLNPGILTLSGYPGLAMLQQGLKPANDAIFICVSETQATVYLFAGDQVKLVRCLYGPAATSSPDLFSANVRRLLFSFQDSKTGTAFTPEQVFLTGSPELPDTLIAGLSGHLGIPVHRFHPGLIPSAKTIIDHDSDPLDRLPTDAFALAACSIKGFKGLNFRKGPLAISRFWQENRKSLIAPAVISLMVMLISGYGSLAAIHDDQLRLAAINQQINQTFKAALPEVRRIVDPVHQMRSGLAEMKQEAPQFDQANRSYRVVDMLRTISDRIPADVDVILSQVVIGPDAILLSGETDTFNTVNTVQQRLAAEPAFKGVSISSANQQKSGNRVNFKMRIQL